jgi:transposase
LTQKESIPCEKIRTGGAFLMAGTKGMLHYSRERKQEAVHLFLEEGYTYREIAEKLGIRKADRIRTWVREFRREGEAAFTKPIGRPRRQPESEQDELERLRMENALLKKLQSELQKDMLAKRDFGQSVITRKSTK